MDKKAKDILVKTFWTSKGWTDGNLRFVDPADLAYAKSKGLMFDPLDISLEEFKNRLHSVVENTPVEKVTDAFLSSLSHKRPDWRSALASYANARREIAAGTYNWYTQGPVDLNVLNFERIKWGGVRHYSTLYNLMDLEILNRETIPPPSTEDIDTFKQILGVIEASADKDTPGKLRDNIKTVYKASKDEISVLMEVMGYACILMPTEDNRSSGGDWGYVGQWRGRDKYNRQQVDEYFGRYLDMQDHP